MAKDKITFEVKFLSNDNLWMLRVMCNGMCVLAPRKKSVFDCLKYADEYCTERLGGIKKKVQITINYE